MATENADVPIRDDKALRRRAIACGYQKLRSNIIALWRSRKMNAAFAAPFKPL